MKRGRIKTEPSIVVEEQQTDSAATETTAPPKPKRPRRQKNDGGDHETPTLTTKRKPSKKVGKTEPPPPPPPPPKPIVFFEEVTYGFLNSIMSFMDVRTYLAFQMTCHSVQNMNQDFFTKKGKTPTIRRAVRACEHCGRGVFRDDPNQDDNRLLCWRCEEKQYHRVYETTAKKMFHLSDKDLEGLQTWTTRNPHTAGYATLYDVQQIEQQCKARYGGWWSYWLTVESKRTILNQRACARAEKQREQNRLEEEIMRASMAHDLQTRRQYFLFTTRAEREQAIRQSGVYRADSQLCVHFIVGEDVNDHPPPSLEQVVAIMRCVEWLFGKGGARVYNEFHEALKTDLVKEKHLTGLSWEDTSNHITRKWDTVIDRWIFQRQQRLVIRW
jgi:hypothetical protein